MPLFVRANHTAIASDNNHQHNTITGIRLLIITGH